MFKEFKYLKRNDLPSIESSYKIAELRSQPVIWDESTRLYLVFPSRTVFYEWYKPLTIKHHHEVIFGVFPQRLKFDIDAKDVDSIAVVMDAIIEAILDELFTMYGIYSEREHLIITTSSGETPSGYKHSYHIIVNQVVENNDEARGFSTGVTMRIPAEYRKYIDAQVNKKVQNFRLHLSTKANSSRVKRITREFGTADGTDLLITAPVGAVVLPKVYYLTEIKTTDPIIAPESTIISQVLDIARPTGQAFIKTVGTLFIFKRTAPSHCNICAEVHHKDNSYMLSLAQSDGCHKIFEMCRQAKGKSRIIGEVVIDGTQYKPSAGVPKATLHERIAAYLDAVGDPHTTTPFEKLEGNVYTSPTMAPYELKPTLAVCAQMKMGKTKALKEYISKYFPDVENLSPNVIRFVTFRQTFSQNIAENFPSFTLYNSIKGELDQVRFPRLIVQVESLHRLVIHEDPIDLLILDEAESIIAQFNSGLHKNFSSAFAAFQQMLRTAKYVICMDANLGERTYNVLTKMRPTHDIWYHWNQFKRAHQDTYYLSADYGSWLKALYANIAAGKRIVIPTNSLSEAKAYHEYIAMTHPTKKIKLYSSETQPSEKTEHFGNVEKYWGELDVLIYTPTCTAGISFELKHFDMLFGYFTDMSCDVETCRQMLGRVRSIDSYSICFSCIGAYLPQTTEAIRQHIYNKRGALYDMSNVSWSYADDGKIEFYENAFFHMWLENIRIINLSRNGFYKRFIDQILDTGAGVEMLDVESDAGVVLELHRGIKKQIIDDYHIAVERAEDLSHEEMFTLLEHREQQVDISVDLRMSFDKYSLRKYYNWFGKPMNAEWISKYMSPNAKRVYKNLTRITQCATIEDSLALIQKQEVCNYENALEHAGGRDLIGEQHKYIYLNHKFAVWLLKCCTFTCITDSRLMDVPMLETSLREFFEEIQTVAPKVIEVFELHNCYFAKIGVLKDKEFVSGMLKFINKPLRLMYGLEVRSSRNIYSLKWNEYGLLFILSHEPNAVRPHIPSNLCAKK